MVQIVYFAVTGHTGVTVVVDVVPVIVVGLVGAWLLLEIVCGYVTGAV